MTDISLRYLLFGEDRSASKAVHGVETAATRSGKVVGGSFSKMGSIIGGEIGELLARAGEGISSLSESAKGLGPKLAVGGAALAGLGGALSMIGSKDKEAQNALQAALSATGNSINDYKEEIEESIKKNENFGHSAADTQQALASMTEALGDPKRALEEMGTVADLAAAKHVSLQSAADMLARGINGSTKVFKQYGITVQSTSSANAGLVKAETALGHAQDARKAASAHLVAVQKQVASGALTGKDAEDKLKEAHKRVADATEDLRNKQEKLKGAHEAVRSAADSTKEAVDQLGNKLKGQAAGAVDSFGGKLHVLATKAGDAIAEFGIKFGPALQIAGAATMALGTVMQVMAARQVAAAAATDAETTAVAGQSLVTKGAAAAQWLLNAAMDANPIGLVVIAIAALVAAFVLAWKHSETFRSIVTSVFHAVMAAGGAAINFIRDHWKLILGILGGPFVAAALVIVSHWHAISSGASTAIGAIKGGWNDFVGFFRKLPGRISGIAGNLWGSIKDGFRAMINGIIDIWNSLHFSLPSVHAFGKTLGGGTIGVPHVNHLATGGVLTSSGDVIVGEHGRELVRLPVGAQVRPLSASDNGGDLGGGGGDLGTFALDLKLDGATIQRLLLKLKRERGGFALGLA